MASKLKPIKDQVIVIGAATGPIGLATARAAARRRARLVLVGSDEALLGETARSINNAGGRADYVVADPTDADAMTAAAFAALARFGRIDSWIDAGSPAGWRTTASALRGRGNAMVVVATHAEEVDALRAELAPAILLGSVRVGADDDPDQVAQALLSVAERPGQDATVADGARSGSVRERVRPYLPGIATAALGLGGLALAVGGFAALRRRRSS